MSDIPISFKDNNNQLAQIVKRTLIELDSATKQNGPFNSAHEGYAVLLEEMDELWDEIKKKKKDRNIEQMKKEATQVAAMGIRFVYDICQESL